ncbi:MAG: hypothetical protein H0X59_05360, partial [Chloroflexi bacterium]|nr:hypothetical protein [Chloroflexota bacterium]
MRIRSKGALTLLAAATLVVTACNTPAASSAPTQATVSTAPTTAPTDAGTSAAPTEGWPLTGTLKDGSTFTLHERVADK